MSIVSELFDEILALPPDEVFKYPFTTRAELLSKKVLLYRERVKYANAFPDGNDIRIQQKINEKKGEFILILSNSPSTTVWLDKGVRENVLTGEVKPFQFSPKEPDITTENDEKARTIRYMKEDGKSPEEIEEELKNLGY
jgi:hypothetical protein